MGYVEIGSADLKYLAATDILIGDMSNINYEYLLYNRPVILLANNWLRQYFPDIGLKTNLESLESAITQSIENPKEFETKRLFWKNAAIFIPDGTASRKYIEIALEKSGIDSPLFILIHGDNSVRKTNLIPIYNELLRQQFDAQMVSNISEVERLDDKTIIFGAHFEDFREVGRGYCIHIDHDLKAPATANLARAKVDYKKNKFFKNIDLHITAGKAGYFRTQYVLDRYKDRVVIGGYSKADTLLSYDFIETKKQVCIELGFDPELPLVTYAPAVINKYMKPGGSLSTATLEKLKTISSRNDDINILVKIKYEQIKSPKERLIKELKRIYNSYRKFLFSDGGKDWEIVINRILSNNKDTINN